MTNHNALEVNQPFTFFDNHGQLNPDMVPDEGQMIALAEGVFFLATHGLKNIPTDVSEQLHPDFDQIMQGNFSDHATWGSKVEPGIARYWDQAHLLKAPPNPRIMGDPNRQSEVATTTGDVESGKESVRLVDFAGVQIFDTVPDVGLIEKWRTDQNGPNQYHRGIVEQAEAVLEKTDGPLTIIDLHDTSEWIMENPRTMRLRYDRYSNGLQVKFPLMVVSDLDGEAVGGDTDFTDDFISRLKEGYSAVGVKVDTACWGDIKRNDPYKGGFVTQSLGRHLRRDLIARDQKEKASRLRVLQVEANRTNILDDRSQEIDVTAANIEALVIAHAINVVHQNR